MDAVMQGKFNYTELGKIIEAQTNRYIQSATNTTNPPSTYNFTTSATAKPHAVYAVLLPGLLFSKNLTMSAGLNSIRSDSSVWGK